MNRNEDSEEELLESLRSLELQLIPDKWVSSIWNSEFTEVEEVPEEYSDQILSEISIESIFSKIKECVYQINECNIINSMVDRSNLEQEDFVPIWSIMTKQNIKYKSFIALLFYYLDKGHKIKANWSDRRICLEASSTYFLLLTLPHSGSFQVFHAILYNKAITSFKLAMKLHLVRLSPKKKRPTKKKKNSQCDGTQSEDSGESGEDESPAETQIQLMKLTDHLLRVLSDFLVFLNLFSLKRCSESLDLTVNELVDLTHLETGSANFNMDKPSTSQNGLSLLALKSYEGLQILLSPIHGDVNKLSKLVFKALLPGVLMIPRGASEIAPRGLSIISDHTLKFVGILIQKFEKDVYDTTEVFIQHLASHVPERAEYRIKATKSIIKLIRILPQKVYNRIVKWFLLWSYHRSTAQRLFSVEMMAALIDVQERGSENDEDDDGRLRSNEQEKSPSLEDASKDLISHKLIFGILLARCQDVSAKVRAKAFKSLADITKDRKDPSITSMLDDIFNDSNSSSRQKQLPNLIDYLSDPDTDLNKINPVPDPSYVVDFLVKQSHDESVYVRKSSLDVMGNIVKHVTGSKRDDLLFILAKHCQDPSLMVRKQLAGTLTDLLNCSLEDETLIELWVKGIFPMILDPEQKASEKALDVVWKMIFENIVRSDCSNNLLHALPWKVLKIAESLGMTKYLGLACGIWYKEKILSPDILNTLKTHINTKNNAFSWLLLSIITVHVPLKDPKFVMDYFQSSIRRSEGVGLYTLLQVLKVLFASVSKLRADERSTLQEYLIILIRKFLLPPELISTAVDIATVVSQHESAETDGNVNCELYRNKIESWASEIIDIIDNDICKTLLSKNQAPEDSTLMRQMFTLGELAQICPQKINKRLFVLLQSVVFQKHETSKPTQELPVSQSFEVSFVASAQLQALAVVTLNKLCVINEEMAKKIVPAYGRLLDVSDDPSVKNNIIYGLSEMCVRYANVIDSLLPQIVRRLKDSHFLVRRTTLITVIHLLQEDYLKIGGRVSFFLRLLQAILDPKDEIKSLIIFFIKQRLLKKHPNIMGSHFIEALFLYNEYVGHSSFNKTLTPTSVKTLYSLAGPNHRTERLTMYKFMLENMNDEQRFQVSHKICQDILKGAVEGKVNILDCQELLRDSLTVLASEDIKLSSLKAKNVDQVDESNEDIEGTLKAEAKKTILSQILKTNVIENIVPIVISLKRILEETKSPLLDDLMCYLRELLKDYKNEIKEILAADNLLAAEIQFDLKKWEEQQRNVEDESSDENNEHQPIIRRAILRSLKKVKKKLDGNFEEDFNGTKQMEPLEHIKNRMEINESVPGAPDVNSAEPLEEELIQNSSKPILEEEVLITKNPSKSVHREEIRGSEILLQPLKAGPLKKVIFGGPCITSTPIKEGLIQHGCDNNDRLSVASMNVDDDRLSVASVTSMKRPTGKSLNPRPFNPSVNLTVLSEKEVLLASTPKNKKNKTLFYDSELTDITVLSAASAKTVIEPTLSKENKKDKETSNFAFKFGDKNKDKFEDLL